MLTNHGCPRSNWMEITFPANGHRFIPVGANWVPAKAAMQWPTQWDPKAIEADFARMHELGFNAIRLDFVWAWIEPRPGDYNPEAFRAIDFLISLAHRYHIYLHPELLIGGEVGEAFWDVPYRQGRHPHSDPDMLRIETDHVAELARRYANEPAILGWDLTDEPPFWIAPETTDAMAINWTRLLSWSMRRYDKLHPIVVGTSMEDVGRGPFRPDNLREEVDFFSVHPYSIYSPKLFPDPMLSERGTYGSAFETALSGSAGHPVMVQEIGASSAQYDPEANCEISAGQSLLRAWSGSQRLPHLVLHRCRARAMAQGPVSALSSRNAIRTNHMGWQRSSFRADV